MQHPRHPLARSLVGNQILDQDFKLSWGRMAGPTYIEDRTCGDCQWDMPTAIPLFIGKALTTRQF